MTSDPEYKEAEGAHLLRSPIRTCCVRTKVLLLMTAKYAVELNMQCCSSNLNPLFVQMVNG